METTFAFPWTILLIPVAVVVIGLPLAAWLLGRGQRDLAMVAGFVALLAGGAFAPAMWNDRVRVNGERIEQTTGMPWSPTLKGFTFSEVDWVHIGSRRTDIGPAQRWEVHFRDGSIEQIDPGDLWESHSARIAALLKKSGVKFR